MKPVTTSPISSFEVSLMRCVRSAFPLAIVMIDFFTSLSGRKIARISPTMTRAETAMMRIVRTATDVFTAPSVEK